MSTDAADPGRIDTPFTSLVDDPSMWPWAHVAAAYLVLAGVRRYRALGPPTDVATLAVGVGALAPDLIDKPLAWRLHVLPSGRTLAHSLLLAGLALVIVGVVARRYDRWSGFAPFALGYLVHIATDAYASVLLRNWPDLFFLIWPLAAPPESGETTSAVAQFLAIEPTPFFLFEIAITAGALALWWSQGRPGIPR